MVNKADKNKARLKRHRRVRSKISGTPECPRLNVFRSSKNIYAQIIDDVNGVTLAAASTLDKSSKATAATKRQRARLASWWQSAQQIKASLRSFLTAVATFSTAVCKNWPKAPVRAASTSKKEELTFG